jgi:DinB family protein
MKKGARSLPEPLVGRASVVAWFEDLYPALGAVTVIDHHVNESETVVATRADVHLTQPPSVLRVVDRFVVDADGAITEQENHYDPRPALGPARGGISQQERDLLLDLLVASQGALITSVVALSPAQWAFAPGRGRWSIAQCAEHVRLSEDMLLGMIRGQILASPAAVDKAAGTRGRDGVVVGAMRDRSHRSETFDVLVPKTSAATPAQFIGGFLAKRVATLRYVRDTTDALHHHVAPLGALGDLDAYQWLLLLASHTERHVQQIEEVKAAAGYPA